MARIRPLRAIAAESNRERLVWAVRVRWLAIGGFSGLSLLAWYVEVLPTLWPSAFAALSSVALNAVNHWCVARWRQVAAVSALAIPADVILITYLVVHTGGTHSPFLMLYVVQVLATAMLVDLAIAAGGALASAACFLGALWLQPGDLAVLRPQSGVHQVIWGLFLLYCLALLTYLGGYIAEQLRRSEDDLAERNQRLHGALSLLEAAHADLQRTVERLRSTENQLVQSEKLRALGQFVAGIAHELNNPIGFVSANLEYLRRAAASLTEMLSAYAAAPAEAAVADVLARRRAALRVDALVADLPSVLEDCEEGARRATEIVAALRTFARIDRGLSGPVDVCERLDRTLALLRHRLGAIRVERRYDHVAPVTGCAGQLDQVLLNLIANAVDAVGSRGTIRLATRLVCDPPAAPRSGPHLAVLIADDGPGMPPDVCARVFEPFFTTKPEGQGTGLGLSVSYAIAERHGGTIAVDSVSGRGTTFVLYLPLGDPTPPASAPKLRLTPPISADNSDVESR